MIYNQEYIIKNRKKLEVIQCSKHPIKIAGINESKRL